MRNLANWKKYSYKMGIVGAEFHKDSWYDLESFLIDGVIFSKEDPRALNSLYFLYEEVLNVINPSKFLRVLNKCTHEDKDLKVICSFIDAHLESVKNKKQYIKLIEKIQKLVKNSEMENYNDKVIFSEFPLFLKFNLNADGIDLENKNKYFKKSRLINCDSYVKRLSGTKDVYSDLISYRKYFPESSIYQASKNLNYDYSTVHEASKSFEKFKVLNDLKDV